MNNLRNINLNASSGLKVLIRINRYKTIADLFKVYIQRLGIGQNVLGKDIIFLFNAETLTPQDTRIINEVFPKDFSTITVLDQKNIIGA